MQTAQQLSNALSLPGVDTCNGIVDVLNGHCGIHQQPEVPASDVAQYGIKIMNQDESELPKYPERTREGLQRYIPPPPKWQQKKFINMQVGLRLVWKCLYLLYKLAEYVSYDNYYYDFECIII